MFDPFQSSHVSPSSLPVTVEHTCFTGSSGVAEWYLVLTPDRYASFKVQLAWVQAAYERFLSGQDLLESCAVWRRFHCSDLQNQESLLEGNTFSDDKAGGSCAVSWVGQSPAGAARISLSAYLVVDPSSRSELSRVGNSVRLGRGSLVHYWRVGGCRPDLDNSDQQGRAVFDEYCNELDREGMSLRDNVVRTWLWVKDVDNNYKGLVDARNDVFAAEGLGQDSHTIASTGIEGEGVRPDQLVTMDAYAISGLQTEQVEYLSALDYLSPTQLYGVAFERATSVSYQDRKHVFISGTASIDWQGKIVHEGDIERQLERTVANIQALLAEAEMTIGDMVVFTVYVRDIVDLPFVAARMRCDYPGIPMVVVRAPVCRPGWLVEIEGIAISANRSESLPAF